MRRSGSRRPPAGPPPSAAGASRRVAASLNNTLAMQEALRAGADEALMCNYRGEIAECAQSNVFLVRDGEALTPPLATGLLEGVTRNFLFEVGPEAGIGVREQVLRLDELQAADEVFVTSTTREVLAVTTLDGRPVGTGAPGPVTMALAEWFRRMARNDTRERVRRRRVGRSRPVRMSPPVSLPGDEILRAGRLPASETGRGGPEARGAKCPALPVEASIEASTGPA